MPLFGRRSRSVSVSRPTTPSTSSPAMLAASQAFMGNQGPQTKLATGAAAAALRSMSPTPTPVSQLQTKRMTERQNSVGARSAPRGRSQGNGVHRRSSSSSMTERTFREPSPGRPATSNGLPMSRNNEPPVPPLPDNYANMPAIPQKSTRRSASIDGFKPTSTKQQPGMRNSMIEVSKTKPAVNPGLAAARRVISGSSTAPQLDRIDSNGSVNFSYPTRARPTSPPPARVSLDSPTTPRGISQTEALRIQNELLQASQQPVKKKKQRATPLAEGSHLQTGTMGSKPAVTPLGPNTAPASTPSPRNLDKDPNSAKLAGQASHFPASPVSPTDSQGSTSDSERSKARRNQRASGALQKQPSVVREDWDGENEENESVVGTSPTPARSTGKSPTPEANVSRKIETSNQRTEPKQAELISAQTTLRTPEPRKPSLSPSRSAHFSNRLSADMTEGQRHVPPPRSVSPRKPALKHSPSPHLARGDRQRDSSRSPSEATDTSTEGHSRNRKSAHVTFDSHPAIVGVGAEPTTPVSPTVASPQHRDKDQRWSGFGNKPQKRAVFAEDSDEDDSMRPRPALPTFGSVRTQRNDTSAEYPPKALSSISSSSTSSLTSDAAPTTMNTSVSSDHAIGGLLAREADDKSTNPSNVPLQDISIYASEPTRSMENASSLQNLHSSRVNGTNKDIPRTMEDTTQLPSIAVQPATPGLEEELKDQWLVDVPGSFVEDTTDGPSPEAPQQSVMLSQQTTVMPTDATETGHGRMPSIQEEDSDRDSVYSDAAEDLSDLEGDGFGSINAIVRSPAPPSPATRSPLPESPIVSASKQGPSNADERSASEWSAAEARWRDKAETAKRVALQPAAPIVERSAIQSNKDASRVARDRSAPSPTPVSTVSATQTAVPVTSINQSHAAAQPAIRKSMRTGTEDTPPRTMRNRPRADSEEEIQKPLRSSMRAAPAPEPVSTRSSVTANAPAPVQGTLQKKNLRSAAPPVQQRPPPVQNDSDSESSFRRRRKGRANDSSKHAMRRSMRAGGAAETRPPTAEQRAVRTQSPVERRPFSPVGGQSTMKTTMRGSMDATPTLRNKPPTERRSSSLFGRRKEAKSPTRPMSVTNFGKSRFGADSDDEGPGQSQRFRSRYADSSDDEEDLRPVRGIPRRGKDDDSTDLDDSSDDGASKAKKSVVAAAPSSPQVSERPTSPLSMNSKKKRGFFGRLKKDKDESSITEPVPIPSTNGKDKASGEKVKRNSETTALGFSSDAQKEALIEQTRQRLLAANEQPTSPVSQSSTPGKLQRRQTPQRILSDSWPLPPKIPDSDDVPARPYTSDGPVTPTRPELNRLSSSATAATSPTGTGSTKTGKKKRFPLLRKAFGLKD